MKETPTTFRVIFMNNILILQIAIFVFGILALYIARSIMNTSDKKGFGLTNKVVFVSIVVITFAGILATIGGDAMPIATTLFGAVIGSLVTTKVEKQP